MKKILMQKVLLLAASGVAGYMLYLLFGDKIGNGSVEPGRVSHNSSEDEAAVNSLTNNGFSGAENGSLPI